MGGSSELPAVPAFILPGRADKAAAWALQNTLSSVLSWQGCPALQIRVANTSYCLDLAAGRDALGSSRGLSTPICYCQMKKSPLVGACALKQVQLYFPAACYHLES